MSHVGNGESDFAGLNDFSPENSEHARRVRECARNIIDALEPQHIDTYQQLISIMKERLEQAEREYRMTFRGRLDALQISNQELERLANQPKPSLFKWLKLLWS